ncbi:hypothetical protein CW733_06935 [Lacinutrix sp. Bg11-31]|nr:hypothetical protein CW733_06935 [Lacinutrix sp. Bg11-31]
MITNFSCNSDYDGCNDSDVPVNFNVKVKLISTSGDNLFNDNDFNVSLLKLTDLDSEITSRAFSQVTENGEELIEFDALNMSSVSFVYDGTEKFYFGFHDIQMETVDCTIRVASYKAKKLNGDLVCNCRVNDTLVITLGL